MSNSISRRTFLKCTGASVAAIGAASLLGGCKQNGGDTIVDVKVGEKDVSLGHGTIAIAAITSCTTATDPAMMVAAGLLARKACERGLATKPWVKRILAPGSRVTSLLLARSGLADTFQLGAHLSPAHRRKADADAFFCHEGIP